MRGEKKSQIFSKKGETAPVGEKNPVFCGEGIEKNVRLLHIIFDMADKSKNSISSDDLKRRRSRRNLAIWLAVVLSASAALAVGVAIGVLSILPHLFEENPRLIVRRIELTTPPDKDGNVRSYSGYWSSRKGLLKDKLEAESREKRLSGASSLWRIDPGDLRRELENPRKFSSIQSARVYRIPPDTLRIELVDRTPRAVVRGSGLLVDETGMLFDPRESIFAGSRLPRIAVNAPGNLPGARDKRLIPAVALIMEVNNTNLSVGGKLDVSEVRLESDGMVCRFMYGDPPIERRAIFPLRDYERNLARQLRALRGALKNLQPGEEGRRDFDLSFSGQVVIKEDKPETLINNNNNIKNNRNNNKREKVRR